MACHRFVAHTFAAHCLKAQICFICNQTVESCNNFVSNYEKFDSVAESK